MSDSTERRPARPVLSRLAGSRWLEPLQAALQAAAAGALLAVAGGHLARPQAPIWLPWWAIALIATTVGLYLIRVEFRHDAIIFTLDEIALVLGLFFAGPAGLIAGRFA